MLVSKIVWKANTKNDQFVDSVWKLVSESLACLYAPFFLFLFLFVRTLSLALRIRLRRQQCSFFGLASPRCDLLCCDWDYLYADEKEKNRYCHELYVPKCRLNIRTVYNIVFYVLIIVYFAGWLSFFKIFYKTETNVNILKFIKERYK